MQIFEDDKVRDECHLRRDEQRQQQSREKQVASLELDNREAKCRHRTRKQLTGSDQDGNIRAVPKEERKIEVNGKKLTEVFESERGRNECFGELVSRQLERSGHHPQKRTDHQHRAKDQQRV
jgi:hypothetical protein